MTKIEWTDATWNPVIGCTPISPGCLNCYAATMANRMQGMEHAKDYQPRRIDDGVPYGDRETIRIAEVRSGRAVYTGDVRTLPDRLVEPLAWKKPRMVFVCSMSDLFHESVPFDFIDRVFAVMALCPQHTFQVLTKRPDRMAEYLNNAINKDGFNTSSRVLSLTGEILTDVTPPHTGCTIEDYRKRGLVDMFRGQTQWPLRNVWLGTSVEDQQRADDRIPHLLDCPAKVRFLSCEPLLGPIDLGLSRDLTVMVPTTFGIPDKIGVHVGHMLHWVIVGGESGSKARECNVNWIRGVVQQCFDNTVPCFVKQLGAKVYDFEDVNGVFSSYTQWCNKARSWIGGTGAMCFDTKMRPCVIGADFIRAEREGCFPVSYHFPVKLRHRKGADMAEWPEDLRVRQFPGGAAC